MASYFPNIGAWYRDNDAGQLFEVVAIDEKYKTIEVQYYDGDISEFDIEAWGSMALSITEAPEEAFIPDDDNPFNQYQDADLASYGNPLDMIEPDISTHFDEFY